MRVSASKMDTKRCGTCGKVKPRSEFYLNKTDPATGKRYATSACIPCYPKQQRGYILKRKYGITIAEYDTMLAAQGGGCAICGTKTNTYRGEARHFAVDHDHDTGRVRGLLCQTCNRMIGLAGDSVERLKAAARYLGGA